MEIYNKLNTIQQKLVAPKGQYNKFGGYYYRSCEDILEGVKSLLKETKTALTITDELVLIGDRYYIKATATLYDENGDSVSNTAYARESLQKKGMDESQITGSCSSYARKYALNGLFCIDDVADADTRDNSDTEKTETATKKKSATKTNVDKNLIDELVARCVADNIDVEKVCALYKVESKDDLSKVQCENALNNWEKVKGKCG